MVTEKLSNALDKEKECKRYINALKEDIKRPSIHEYELKECKSFLFSYEEQLYYVEEKIDFLSLVLEFLITSKKDWYFGQSMSPVIELNTTHADSTRRLRVEKYHCLNVQKLPPNANYPCYKSISDTINSLYLKE